jgi:hypothetical protein
MQLSWLHLGSRDTKPMGYGIRRTRARKPRALPSVRASQSKTIILSVKSDLTDAIHFRAPENWRGKVKSKRVREWFNRLLDGRSSLAPSDPGPGSLELSVRVPRRALKDAARLMRIPGTVLLRRLIAAQIAPRSSGKAVASEAPRKLPAPTPASEPGSSRLRPTSLPVPMLPSAPCAVRKAEKRLTIVTHVEGVRSLEEIDRAKCNGDGITFEELVRWQTVFERK